MIKYCVLTGIILLMIVYFVHSPYNYVAIKPCNKCDTFKVNKSLGNSEAAAWRMQEIKDRVAKLVDYMERKYDSGSRDHIELARYIDIDRALSNVRRRFSTNRFFENSPFNIGQTTAFTDNKDTLYVCLRNKDGIMHDMSTLMYVVLHELAHMMLDTYGHENDFWTTNKFLLLNAKDAGVYDPIDYSKSSVDYCGLELTNNPYFY